MEQQYFTFSIPEYKVITLYLIRRSGQELFFGVREEVSKLGKKNINDELQIVENGKHLTRKIDIANEFVTFFADKVKKLEAITTSDLRLTQDLQLDPSYLDIKEEQIIKAAKKLKNAMDQTECHSKSSKI